MMTEQERNNIATAAIGLERRVSEKLDQYRYMAQIDNPLFNEMRGEIMKEIELFADFLYYEDHDF